MGIFHHHGYPVIPLTFDDNLSFYEILRKVVDAVNGKQDTLIAGDHIKIENNVISTSIEDATYVRMTDNADGGVNLRVDFTTKNLALESDHKAVKEIVVKNKEDIISLLTRVRQNEIDLATAIGVQIPENVVSETLNSYVSAHEGELATKLEVDAVDAKFENLVRASKNLFNIGSANTGCSLNNDGTLTNPTTTNTTTDYIPVTAGRHYMVSYNSNAYTFSRACFYSANKSFLSFQNGASEFNAPVGASFIRIQIPTNRVDTLQVEEGTVRTAYSPYSPVIKDASIPIDYIEQAVHKSFHVSVDGSDSNSGSVDHPLASVTEAINRGASVIYLGAGVYHEHVRVTRLGNLTDHLTIYGYGAIFEDAFDGDGAFIDLRLGNVDIYGVTTRMTDTFRRQVEAVTPTPNLSGFSILACVSNMVDCNAENMVTNGFRFDGSNMRMNRCYAERNGNDGFNAHQIVLDGITYESDSTHTDCYAYNNGDDGLSTHEHSHCVVHGGEYSGNRNGGVTPFGFAKYIIDGVILRNNGFGIEAFTDTERQDYVEIVSKNNIILDNTIGMYASYYQIISVNDVYGGNTTNKSVNQGAIVEY